MRCLIILLFRLLFVLVFLGAPALHLDSWSLSAALAQDSDTEDEDDDDDSTEEITPDAKRRRVDAGAAGAAGALQLPAADLALPPTATTATTVLGGSDLAEDDDGPDDGGFDWNEFDRDDDDANDFAGPATLSGDASAQTSVPPTSRAFLGLPAQTSPGQAADAIAGGDFHDLVGDLSDDDDATIPQPAATRSGTTPPPRPTSGAVLAAREAARSRLADAAAAAVAAADRAASDDRNDVVLRSEEDGTASDDSASDDNDRRLSFAHAAVARQSATASTSTAQTDAGAIEQRVKQALAEAERAANLTVSAAADAFLRKIAEQDAVSAREHVNAIRDAVPFDLSKPDTLDRAIAHRDLAAEAYIRLGDPDQARELQHGNAVAALSVGDGRAAIRALDGYLRALEARVAETDAARRDEHLIRLNNERTGIERVLGQYRAVMAATASSASSAGAASDYRALANRADEVHVPLAVEQKQRQVRLRIGVERNEDRATLSALAGEIGRDREKVMVSGFLAEFYRRAADRNYDRAKVDDVLKLFEPNGYALRKRTSETQAAFDKAFIASTSAAFKSFQELGILKTGANQFGFASAAIDQVERSPRSYVSRNDQVLQMLSRTAYKLLLSYNERSGNPPLTEVQVMFHKGSLFVSSNLEGGTKGHVQDVQAFFNELDKITTALTTTAKAGSDEEKEIEKRITAKFGDWFSGRRAPRKPHAVPVFDVLKQANEDTVHGYVTTDGRFLTADRANASEIRLESGKIYFVQAGVGRAGGGPASNVDHAEGNLVKIFRRTPATDRYSGDISFVAGSKRPCVKCEGNLRYSRDVGRADGRTLVFNAFQGSAWFGQGQLAAQDPLANLQALYDTLTEPTYTVVSGPKSTASESDSAPATP